MNKEKECCEARNDRLGKVGGQAVLEGVMMKAGNRTVTTCRKEDGTITVSDAEFVSVRKKHKILNIPVLRGVINFVEMMILSVKTLNVSAEALGLEEEEGKFEKWMKKHLGLGITDIIMVLATVLGVALSLFLFMFLPGAVSDLVEFIVEKCGGYLHPTPKAIIEGVAKIGIFLLYLWLVSLIPDIKRTFMYHGAEHKSIACFEAGEELTPDNAMKHKRFHPRCGTSFMFVMIALGIFVGIIVNNLFGELPRIALTGIRLLILPIVVGIGFEFIMLAGKHDNLLTRTLSAPGLWVQRLTTKEPTPDMLELAIISLKGALRDKYAEFEEFFESRPWEAKEENKEDGEEGSCEGSEEKCSEESGEPAGYEGAPAPINECAPIKEDTADTDLTEETGNDTE